MKKKNSKMLKLKNIVQRMKRASSQLGKFENQNYLYSIYNTRISYNHINPSRHDLENCFLP